MDAVTDAPWVSELSRSEMRLTAAAAATFADPGGYPPLATVLLDLAQALDRTADVMQQTGRCRGLVTRLRDSATEARREITRCFERGAPSGEPSAGGAAAAR